MESVERIEFDATAAQPLRVFEPNPKEMMFYLYLPIKMIDSGIIEIPPNLDLYRNMIGEVMYDFDKKMGHKPSLLPVCHERYVYLTAKTLYVTPDNIGNRPGYHCDGFGTDDVNYIWCDKYPTVFNSGHFSVRADDLLSLEDMQQQAKPENEYQFDEKVLTRIDSLCPHRTPTITKAGMRTFVKISISRHRYNLEGNSHNYLFNYDWTLHPREEIRNMENKDFHL